MSNELPKNPANENVLTYIGQAAAQPYFEKKMLALDNGTTRGAIGAMALLHMHEQGVLQEFTEWATHPKSGIMYRHREVHPVPEKLEVALTPIVEKVNQSIKAAASQPAEGNPFFSRRAVLKRVRDRAVVFGLAAGVVGAAHEAQKAQPGKKTEATVKGAAKNGLVFGALIGGVGLAVEGTVAILANRITQYAARRSANHEAESACIETDDVLQYACQALERFTAQEQSKHSAR